MRSGLNVARGTKILAIDTETTGIQPWGHGKHVRYVFGQRANKREVVRKIAPARPFVFTCCDEEGNTDYVRWDVDPYTREVTVGKRADQIAAVLADPTLTKIGHNLRFDLVMLEHAGFKIAGPCFDTMILAHLVTSGAEFTYALKPFAKKYLEYDDGDEKALEQHIARRRAVARRMEWSYATEAFAGGKPLKADYWLDTENKVQAYAVGDVIRTMLLWKSAYDEVMSDDGLRYLFKREHKLFWVLKRMEARGVRVFPKDVHRLERFYDRYIVKQQKAAIAAGGAGLNFNSGPQMCEMFYEKRGHKPNFTETFNHKKGRYNYSLNGEQLAKLAETDPLAKAALEIKAGKQVKSVFLEPYRRLWVKEAPGVYILHPNFKQTGARTGRLSCGEPNLQQVASETTGRRKAEIPARPREAFGPRPGYLWMLPDYSQIEVWLFAFLSGEKRMQKLLLSGEDFHGAVAKAVFGNEPDFEEKRDYYRKCGKLIMFLILYGGGAGKLMDLLKTADIGEAKAFLTKYYGRFPGVRTYMDEIVDTANTVGELRNVFGRRYTFDPGYGYRGVNYMIQGTASEVMKNAMIRVDHYLQTVWHDEAYLINNIHDELKIEVPVDLYCEELVWGVVKQMQRDSKKVGLPIQFPVDVKIVRERWNRTEKVKIPAVIRGGTVVHTLHRHKGVAA